MEKLKPVSKADIGRLLLMSVSCLLITVTGIVYGQSLLRIMPLYISLIVGLLQSRVNRFAPLLGGINSLLYAAVYMYYGLYASAIYSFLVSCPLQIVTFANWSRRKYGQSVRFKRMSVKVRLLTSAVFAVCWLVMYVVMSKLGSSYMLFDNTVTLFGILITILTMLAYIEYTGLMIPSCLCGVGMYAAMLGENPEQVTYLIHAVYALICNCISFVHAKRLYAEQNREGN